MPKPVLHLISGKIASGKSTLAKSLVTEGAAIVLSEDHWLSRLYPEQVKSVADYVCLARQIREVLGLYGALTWVTQKFPHKPASDSILIPRAMT